MNQSFFFSLHFSWIILVLVNFAIQLAYFYKDKSRGLFGAKKITTPLLLFFGLFIVILNTQSFPFIPGVILLAMALGEIGIEGSSVVQAKEGGEDSKDSIIVTLAGVLFLLVNVFIGIVLFVRIGVVIPIVIGLIIGVLSFLLMNAFVFRVFKPRGEVRMQIVLYSVGLVVLCGGAGADVFAGLSHLGLAALILTISDSLVLIRMGAAYEKDTVGGFRILLAFLVLILILYYVYMGVLIHMGAPFII